MGILKKIHDLKVAEYRQHYKWYAHADPEIRDKLIVRNFHMTKSQYDSFCRFIHSVEFQYGKNAVIDYFKYIYPFSRINRVEDK